MPTVSAEVSPFAALADPGRRRILDLLRERERTVNELVEAVALAQPTVSKHLKLLRAARLVDVRADAQHRVYRLRFESLIELDRWLEPYRRMWSERLRALEEHLRDMDEHAVRET